jgi:nitroreductase
MLSDIDGIRKRRSIQFFNDKVPEKEIIEKILDDSVKYSPNRCAIPYHHVKVFGPEFKEDKEKIVIQTNCDPKFTKTPDSQEKIRQSKNLYEIWIRMSKDNDYTKQDIKEECGVYDYNPQILAPYVFVYYDNDQTQSDFDQSHINLNATKSRERACQSSAIHAILTACIAAEHDISSCFLSGIDIRTEFNKNAISDNVNLDKIVLILCLGYPDEQNKYNPKLRYPFDVNDIIEWQNV